MDPYLDLFLSLTHTDLTEEASTHIAEQMRMEGLRGLGAYIQCVEDVDTFIARYVEDPHRDLMSVLVENCAYRGDMYVSFVLLSLLLLSVHDVCMYVLILYLICV